MEQGYRWKAAATEPEVKTISEQRFLRWDGSERRQKLQSGFEGYILGKKNASVEQRWGKS